MVDVSVDILNYDLPERSDSSIIFHVNTPWVQEHRLWMNENLSTYETKNKFLPTWEVSKFVKFLNTKSGGPGQGQVAMFIEFRYSNAPVENLKNPGTIEEFGGMSGTINLYDIIFGCGPNPIIKELEVINVLENKRVGRINTRISCAIWPVLRELLLNLPRTASVLSLQFQDPILSDCKDLPSSSSKCNWNPSSQRTAEDKRIILGHNAAVVSLEDSVETSNVFDAPIDPDDDALADTKKCILALEQQHRIPSAIPKRLLPTAGAPRTPDRVRALRDSMFEEPSFGSPQMFGNTPEVVRIRRKYRSFSSTNPPTQPLSPTSIANTQTRVRERLRSYTDSYDDPERDVPSESSYLLFENSMENPNSKDLHNPPTATDGNNNQSHAGTSDRIVNAKGSYEVAHKDVEKVTIQVPANTP